MIESVCPILLFLLPVHVVLSTHLLSFSPAHAWLDLAQHLAHKQDAIDHNTIRRAFDFEVSKECVGSEEGKDLVEWIVRLV
jgi:hypothetical protein